MSKQPFSQWFISTTKTPAPWRWQAELAIRPECRNQLIRIPTGMGKTLGVLSAWAYNRLVRSDSTWPRRLVWCLPMRTLVEQTYDEARGIIEKAGLRTAVSVNMLMGGVAAEDWHHFPERPAIIVGTQDMLLSRALNRGYAASRARWPIDFGLLNHDALWVMDEVQLMDVGLATSAQIQAFRDADGQKTLRPCITWWMSATLQPEWLRSVDTESFHSVWSKDICSIPPADRSGELWEIRKSCSTQIIDIKKSAEFADCILTAHQQASDEGFGRITLVVCNTVDRAIEIYDALAKSGRTEGLELVHSRFRPAERENWRERFLTKDACQQGVDRIIVATQVVEAGVDISATCLVTELAPWSSLVQRFGRCARYGGTGTVIVVDRGHDEKLALPYSADELEAAWNTVQGLDNVSVKAIEELEQGLTPESLAKLYPYSPAHLLLRSEFDELFDTTPDLTGADLDISRFIRSGDERDLQVFWQDVAPDALPSSVSQPDRRELCSVPFLLARDWLCGKETQTKRSPKLKPKMRAWIWDWIDGNWVVPRRENLLPGRVICVDSKCGGYDLRTGFSPESKTTVPTVAPPVPLSNPAIDADAQQSSEALSVTDHWKTIACHSREVAETVTEIAKVLELSDELVHVLRMTATWHDLGKAHPAFQGLLQHSDRPERLDLAKGPQAAWVKPPAKFQVTCEESESVTFEDSRPGFRHELASALALFAILERFRPQHPALLGQWQGVFETLGTLPNFNATDETDAPAIQAVLDASAEQFDLLIYLIASHHGKVRGGLFATPKDQDYRDHDGQGLPIQGVRENDLLASIEVDGLGMAIPELKLTLEPARMGLSPRTGASWRERSLSLVERYGPTTLAWLEAVFRAADVRASRLSTPDPALKMETVQ
ncbi:MAG: CRISPR-associated helicase Cas3' [Pirellulaceae bacterium]|nr:CRISPR-associated helicase Cas3' [Pirellulaceae bacterium]